MKRKPQAALRTLLAYSRDRATITGTPHRQKLASGLLVEWRITPETVTLILMRPGVPVSDNDLNNVRIAADVPADAVRTPALGQEQVEVPGDVGGWRVRYQWKVAK